jgi:hypothetical protein
MQEKVYAIKQQYTHTPGYGSCRAAADNTAEYQARVELTESRDGCGNFRRLQGVSWVVCHRFPFSLLPVLPCP